MKMKFFMFSLLGLATISSCQQKDIKYEIYSRGHLAFTINPDDIEFYDTINTSLSFQLHRIWLKKDFYQKDSIELYSPLELICKIGNKQYFWSDFYHSKQSWTRLWVNFKFHSSCENYWTAQEERNDTLILRTKNKCNSIDFLFVDGIPYLDRKNKHYLNHIDTARLANEILLDPYYLNAIIESGITIK